MKKNILTYIISCIALIMVRILVYNVVIEMSLIAFVFINLVLPSLIIMIANGIINYGQEKGLKNCWLHAVSLAVLSMIINLSATNLVGDRAVDNLIENVEVENSGSFEQELLDELDRQARQTMIEAGLISEDDVIYSEPYIGNIVSPANSANAEQLTGTWDVQIEKENTLSTVTGTLLDIVLAFIGGMIGTKFKKKKKTENLLAA